MLISFEPRPVRQDNRRQHVSLRKKRLLAEACFVRGIRRNGDEGMADRLDYELRAIEADNLAETAYQVSWTCSWRDIARGYRLLSDFVADAQAAVSDAPISGTIHLAASDGGGATMNASPIPTGHASASSRRPC